MLESLITFLNTIYSDFALPLRILIWSLVISISYLALRLSGILPSRTEVKKNLIIEEKKFFQMSSPPFKPTIEGINYLAILLVFVFGILIYIDYNAIDIIISKKAIEMTINAAGSIQRNIVKDQNTNYLIWFISEFAIIIFSMAFVKESNKKAK